jgi:uncharacterized membrane protein
MTTAEKLPEPHSTWHSTQKESLSRGQRAADVMRNTMGSWPFVFGFLAFMAIWAALNSLGVVLHAWDKYPFILLNLFLSMLAGLQWAILLIAAKRQDAIAAALAEHDYSTNLQAKADIESLLTINKRQLVIIEDLQAILKTLDHPTYAKPKTKKRTGAKS